VALAARGIGQELIAGGAQFLGAEHLAMRAVAADLGASEDDFETEVTLDLFAHFQQQIAKEFFDFAAAEADDVGVLLLEASFVIVLVAIVMHQVQLIDKAAGFEELEGAIDGDAVELRVFFATELIELVGIQVLAGLIDEIEQDFALAGEPDATLFERVFDAGDRHGSGLNLFEG
jgi:hypothetical protein